MSASLGAIAAHAHLAPTAAFVLALVEEQPAAVRVGALLDAIDPRPPGTSSRGEMPGDLGDRGQEIGRRTQQRPERRLEAKGNTLSGRVAVDRGPAPDDSSVALDEAGMAKRLGKRRAQAVERALRQRGTVRDRGEDLADDLPRPERAMERPCGARGILLRARQQNLRLGGQDRAGMGRPSNEMPVRADVLPLVLAVMELAGPPPEVVRRAGRVGEIETKRAAEQWRKIEMSNLVLWLTAGHRYRHGDGHNGFGRLG